VTLLKLGPLEVGKIDEKWAVRLRWRF